MRYRLQCSACPEGESLGHTNIGEERATHVVPQTFARRGWIVGRTPERDLCPACAHASGPIPMKPEPSPMVSNTVTPMRSAAPAAPAAQAKPEAAGALPPREMSRDERRIINAKIDEVYVDEAHGYTIGWNDDRVAADLGVPRAWIAKMRDENFGPDHNVEVTKARGEADRLTAEMAALRVHLEESVKIAGLLLSKADACRADLARLTAATGRK